MESRLWEVLLLIIGSLAAAAMSMAAWLFKRQGVTAESIVAIRAELDAMKAERVRLEITLDAAFRLINAHYDTITIELRELTLAVGRLQGAAVTQGPWRDGG